MTNAEQLFLNALDSKLWASADKLRSSLDAAVYKHAVLPLIFLKYASDAFELRRAELARRFKDPADEYYMDPAHYGLMYEADFEKEIVNRDYYQEVNVFWVPEPARWLNLRECCKTPVGGDLPWGKKMRGVRFLLDEALTALAAENDRLKGVLDRENFTRYEVPELAILGLIDLFSDTDFTATEYEGQKLNLRGKDIVGHVYEYFLGQFALAEGRKGGQYWTPKSIVTLIVEMLQPFKGRVFDPAMGTGGFFVQSEKFIEEHAGERHYKPEEQKLKVSIYGQESNPTTWRLAAMNMAIRNMDCDFGKEPADSFTNDQHPDLRADFVMANPPFNMKDWGSDEVRRNDPRWKIAGTPPARNANFAWLQHMLYHLCPTGSMALLLANGSMSSNTSGEGDIRRNLVEADVVECMVALPGQLFTNTQIPACIWFLTKSKKARGTNGGQVRDRQEEILFIDAREVGYMKDRVLRDFTAEDVKRIAGTYHAWQKGEGYGNVAGFCYSAKLDEIVKHDFVLTPGRYVGAVAGEDDGEPFADKMARLTKELGEQLAESERLEAEIRKNLAGLGWQLGDK